MKSFTLITALFIAFAVVTSASQTPARTSTNRDHMERQKTGEGKRPIEGALLCTDQSPCAVKLLQSEEAKILAARDIEYGQDKARMERLTAWATVALALVTFVLAFFTFRLWSITRTLVEKAEDTARKQLRAYVALESIDHFHKKGPLRFGIHNYGKTPAHHVSVMHRVYEEAQEATFKLPATSSSDPLTNQMLHPGQQWNYDAVGGPEDRVLEAGLNFQDVFYVYSRIDYMDIYKRYWVTYFGQKYDPKQPAGQRCTPHYYHNYEFPLT